MKTEELPIEIKKARFIIQVAKILKNKKKMSNEQALDLIKKEKRMINRCYLNETTPQETVFLMTTTMD